jgi:protein TonB
MALRFWLAGSGAGADGLACLGQWRRWIAKARPACWKALILPAIARAEAEPKPLAQPRPPLPKAPQGKKPYRVLSSRPNLSLSRTTWPRLSPAQAQHYHQAPVWAAARAQAIWATAAVRGAAVRARRRSGGQDSRNDHRPRLSPRRARRGLAIMLSSPSRWARTPPTACRIHRSSRDPAADTLTCRMVMERFRFNRPVTATGAPLDRSLGGNKAGSCELEFAALGFAARLNYERAYDRTYYPACPCPVSSWWRLAIL